MQHLVKVVEHDTLKGKIGDLVSTKFDPESGRYMCTIKILGSGEKVVIQKSCLKFLKK